VLVALVSLAVAWGLLSHGSTTDAAGQHAARPRAAGSGPLRQGDFTWTGLSACSSRALRGLACGTLTVPLDRTVGDPASPGTLDLPVVVGGNLKAGGTLLMLSGGPGQPGVALAPRIFPRLEGVAEDYRLVMVDQRGTGANALDCPSLQAEIGFSDLEIPTGEAVAECALTLGAERAQYSTGATVADLEDLRQALGTKRWSIDGVSYGSYVAQRYAGAHPDRVDRLVLDSVVPVEGIDPTMVEAFPEVARVLRAVCAQRACSADPAAELATVLARAPELGPRLLDVLSVMSVVDVGFTGMPEALHGAASGSDAQLLSLLASWQDGTSGPADELSQGLHASTLCLDLDFPWGGADAPLTARARAADVAVARLADDRLWPFTAETARTNGFLRTCELWPPEPDLAVPSSQLSLRGVSALILRGDRDLSTLLAWAERAHADLPGSRLVVVPGVGHSVQGTSETAREAVARFLLDRSGAGSGG
jgi:pimeloyl-ACP methyl ester carboxylesterase